MPPKKETKDVQALAAALSRLMKDESKAGPSKQKASKKKKNKSRAGRGQGTAEIRFSRTELVADVTIPATKSITGEVAVHPDSAPILKKLGAAFDRCRWERVQFYWVSAVSAMTSGNVVMGVDWDSTPKTTPTQADVSAYAPSAIIPLRESTQSTPLRLPADKLRGRNWYEPYAQTDKSSKQPAVLVYSASGGEAILAGHIMMTYTVVLAGPHA